MDNPSIAPERSVADWLIAVGRHLEAHPHLKDSVLGAQGSGRYVHVAKRSGESPWRALLSWADTLDEIGQVVVKANNDSPHIMLLGASGDTALNVMVVVSNLEDITVLASRVDLKRGNRFDLGVIRDIVERGALARVRVIRQGDIYDGVIVKRTERRISLGSYAAWYPGEGEYVAGPTDRLSIPLDGETTVVESVDAAAVEAAHELALAGTRVTS